VAPGASFTAAQAQRELLAALDITSPGFTPGESAVDGNVLGGDDDDNA
jgi:hypothetical protein